MVLSINEQITSLETEFENVKGPGSKEKKKELQKEIDALKKMNSETKEEEEKTVEAAPVVKDQSLPPYKKATMGQVRVAEKAGKLCGFDAENMTASIRD